MGYGKRAMESLSSFYSGDLLNLDEVQDEDMAESYAEASRVEKVRFRLLLAMLLSLT
jgi:N-acetyltransferase 10